VKLSAAEIIADTLLMAVVLGASAAGFVAHLYWLAVTDPGELWSVAFMFWEVIAG
jgi:hypothetical protein